jgi:hypothetical protein
MLYKRYEVARVLAVSGIKQNQDANDRQSMTKIIFDKDQLLF